MPLPAAAVEMVKRVSRPGAIGVAGPCASRSAARIRSAVASLACDARPLPACSFDRSRRHCRTGFYLGLLQSAPTADFLGWPSRLGSPFRSPQWTRSAIRDFASHRRSAHDHCGQRQLNGDEMLQGISAITLATHNMARAVAFYEALGFVLKFGGPEAHFTSFHAGKGYLNLTQMAAERTWSWWGRAIFYADDVDAQHARAVLAGLSPAFAPRDAPWGERYFHIVDPDGHELSFAQPL